MSIDPFSKAGRPVFLDNPPEVSNDGCNRVTFFLPRTITLQIVTTARIDSIALVTFRKENLPTPPWDPGYKIAAEKIDDYYQVQFPSVIFANVNPDCTLWISGCWQGQRQFTIQDKVSLLGSQENGKICLSPTRKRPRTVD